MSLSMNITDRAWRSLIKRSIITIFLALLASAASVSFVSAESGITMESSSAVIAYPASITFNMTASSDVEITDVRLRYRVERESFADIVTEVKPEFNPSRKVSASWTWDMYKTGNLPPGAGVEFWWKIYDSDGNLLVTDPQSLSFDDNNHQWQSIEEGSVTLYWYNGSQVFAERLMTVAQEGLIQLKVEAGAELSSPVSIYIYGSATDMQNAMIYVQDWAGGLAFTGYGVIAIGITPTDMTWGENAMVHELAHLVTFQMTSNPYNGIPIWLNEGLSKYAEGELDSYSEGFLRQAALNDSLISVTSLASPFSAYGDKTTLSYAESYSLVDYLIQTYGAQKMSDLLDAFKLGSTYNGALTQVYGFDMDGLDSEWELYIKDFYGAGITPESGDLLPMILIASVGGTTLAPIVIYSRRKKTVS